MAMFKRILKVKYIYEEDELNEFLKNVPLEVYTGVNANDGKETQITKLHRISYYPLAAGEGNTDNIAINTKVLAVVEYWDYAYDYKQ